MTSTKNASANYAELNAAHTLALTLRDELNRLGLDSTKADDLAADIDDACAVLAKYLTNGQVTR